MKKNDYYPLFFCLCLFSTLHMEAQIFVRTDADGMNDGTSWEDAYTDLQDALLNAPEGDSIWVAAGTYLPDNTEGNVFATFLIERDLVLRGGFPAGGGTLEDRDPATHPTILSGDLNGDDVDDDFENHKADNVMTVVTIYSTTTNETVIDGFIISNGHADGTGTNPEKRGGGIWSAGAPVIRNCTFQQNYAIDNGGAIEQRPNTSSPIVLEHCLFKNNSANLGMAVDLFKAQFDIKDCIFQDNVDHGDLPSGGAVYILDPLGGSVRSCTFQNNEAGLTAGMVVWRRQDDDPGNILVEIIDCTFEGNTSHLDENTLTGGGLTLVTVGDHSTYRVKGCTFLENSTMGSGGGIALLFNGSSNNASMIIDSCLFSNNIAKYNGSGAYAAMFGEAVNLEIKRCTFLQNMTTLLSAALDFWGTGGGTGLAKVDSCLFEGNVAGNSGAIEIGNGHNGGASIDFVVTNSTFRENEAMEGGAIKLWSDEDSPTDITVENCAFYENKAAVRGGAFTIKALSNSFNTKIKRTIISDNESPLGGAIDVHSNTEGGKILIENTLISGNDSDNASINLDALAQLSLFNCTIAKNQSNGIEIANQSTLTLQNTILYNPGYSELEVLTDDVTITSIGGNLIGDNSLMSDAHPYDKQNQDPLLSDDFYPTEDSPAVDAGMNAGNLPETDLVGNDRIINCVDIGAYESEFMVATECLTGVRELIIGQVELSPNPASDFVYVQLPENVNGPVVLQLFDLQGQLVQQKEIFNNTEMEVGDLPEGMYVVKLVDEEKVYSGQFIKH